MSAPEGGPLVSDGGATLLGVADRSLRLTERLADLFGEQRRRDRVAHSIRAILRQRIFAIAQGYEDLNDHLALRDDEMLQLLVGHTPGEGQLASPATLSRFENRPDDVRLLRVMELLVDVFVESRRGRAPDEPLVLDIDATADRAHGKQERNHFHAFHGDYCFLPLYIFCGDQILFAWLRPSSRSAAYNARAALAVVTRRLRHHWPEVEIVVRADSGFAVPRVLDWCDAEGVGYVLGFPKNSLLNSLLEGHMNRARKRSEATGRTAREYASFRYQARSWPWRRRVVAKAEWTEGKPNPRYVVTSLRGRARAIYEAEYCARGDMENRIKEQQYGLFSDRTSCHRFRSNQLRVALSACAYVLVEHIRRVGLRGTAMDRAQAWTIRERLFKVAARVSISVRRIRIQISETWPNAEILHRAMRNLVRWSTGPPEWRLA